MVLKIDNSTKRGHGPIKVMYPGLTLQGHDTGLATLGRIDQAAIPPGVLIAMHPHVNDEILTYLRSGRVRHTDSAGFSEVITPGRLMLMKAGKTFFHEEHVAEDSGLLEALQIFVRPEKKDLEPEVSFCDLPDVYSENQWRLIAGRDDSDAPLILRSSTWIWDMRVTEQKVLDLPDVTKGDLTFLLYVFQGAARVGDVPLGKGESLIIKDESNVNVQSEGADLVLFATDERSHYYAGGMFSGNQY